jgi:hypothetical protein
MHSFAGWPNDQVPLRLRRTHHPAASDLTCSHPGSQPTRDHLSGPSRAVVRRTEPLTLEACGPPKRGRAGLRAGRPYLTPDGRRDWRSVRGRCGYSPQEWRCINQPVAQRLPVELRWGVSAANVSYSAAEWGDRALREARWRPRGDRFGRDPFVRQAEIYRAEDRLIGHIGTVERPANAPNNRARSRLICVRHEAHCCIARVAGMDWRRCLWI